MGTFILNLICTVLWTLCCGLNIFLAITSNPFYWIIAVLDLVLIVLNAITTKISWENYQAQKQYRH